MQPAAGAHVTLPSWYGGPKHGMIIPKTKVRESGDGGFGLGRRCGMGGARGLPEGGV